MVDVLRAARPLSRPSSRPMSSMRRPRRRRGAAILLGGLLLAGAVGAGGVALTNGSRSGGISLTTPGVGRTDGEGGGGAGESLVTRGALAVEAVVNPASRLDDAKLVLDGTDVTARAERRGDRLVLDTGALPEGQHTLAAELPRGSLLSRASTRTLDFSVDTTPPEVSVKGPEGPVGINDPVEFQGRVDPGTRVTAGDRPVELGSDGSFTVRYDKPPAPGLQLVATDAAGNTASKDLGANVGYPDVRAVHVSALAWSSPVLKAGIMKLIDEKRVNAVELSLKDESGIVGWASKVPMAQQIGAAKPIYDIEEAVKELHDKGMHVIGRLVVFNDPILAEHAWTNGRRDELVQTPTGDRLGGKQPFVNLANPTVRQYNLDLAVEAARAGVDDILYDYIRRPDKSLSSMRFPGLQGTPEDAIVSFMAESRLKLRAEGAYLGASVFGWSALHPEYVAQDIPRMAKHADYIAPMVYPSHWGKGDLGVADPNRMPAEITLKSVQDFVRVTQGTGTKIVPWLQSFSLFGVKYGPNEVRAQIDASAKAGAPSFILWDPNVRYFPESLAPTPA